MEFYYYSPLVDFLTGKTPYSMECQLLGQALVGAMAVKRGRNWDGELHWFHAFVMTSMGSFAGGLFNFMWLGKPTSMISNDVVFACCVIAFTFINYIPLDLGFKLANILPVKIVITICATLFRSGGMMGFITMAFNTFAESPSKYYPIPVFGPIWYGIMLGNMGGFVSKGVDGYLGAGMPWPFQNGIFCAPFFHFYVHDQTGPIGEFLRSSMAPVHGLFPDLDDRMFAMVLVSLFMQIVGLLQLPAFLGPSFSPFVAIGNMITAPLASYPKAKPAKPAAAVMAKKALASRAKLANRAKEPADPALYNEAKKMKNKRRKQKQG